MKKSNMTRREFLSFQAKGALFLAAAGQGLIWPDSSLAAGPDIGIATGSPRAATRAAVELLGGMKSFVKPGAKVVIKPNMSFANPPEMATTTHPEVISTLAAMCREAGASKVDILDHTLNSAELCLEQTGIKASCQVVSGAKVEGVISSNRFVESRISSALSMGSTDVLKEVLQADVLIAAPVAKHHSSTGVSLSMKGMMGLIYNRSVMHWKYDLHAAIVDLATLCRPHLVVIDATRVLTSNGPGGPGKVIKPNTVIASRDMVAADAQAVSMFEWYGQKITPAKVKHIRLAHEQKLGRMDVENLNIAKVSV